MRRYSTFALRGLLLLLLGCLAARAADAPDLPGLVAALPSADYPTKQALIRQMLELHDPRARAVFAAMLEGHLYARSDDGRVFITRAAPAAAAGEQSAVGLIDPLTGADAGQAALDSLNHIGVNNQLRKALRVALAQFDLSSAGCRRASGRCARDAARGRCRGDCAAAPAACARAQCRGQARDPRRPGAGRSRQRRGRRAARGGADPVGEPQHRRLQPLDRHGAARGRWQLW